MSRPLLTVLLSGSVLIAAGCGDDDAPADQDAAPTADAVSPACPIETTGPTEHAGEISADETWTALDGPHVVTANLRVNGATLTIEPCVEVQVAADVSIAIGVADGPGTLVAEGTAAQPISFTARDVDPWDNLRVLAPATASLAYVTFNGAGADGVTYDGATLIAYGSGERPLQPILGVDHVVIDGSAGYGALINRFAAFTAGSSELSITGAGASHPDHKHPIYIQAQALGTLPSGDYTDNAVDEIHVNPRGDIETSVTIEDRGVPYRVDGVGNTTLVVARANGDTAAGPVLTIEAGTTLLFDAGMDLRLGHDTVTHGYPGGLVVNGTAAAPVTFSSSAASPAPGDWRGIVFQEPPPAGTANKIDHAIVEYAGDGCSCGGWGCPAVDGDGTFLDLDAGILIYSWRPDTAFVTNTELRNIDGWGILRGWDDTGPDFTPTNTFTNLTYCDQSWPQPTGDTCPDPPYVCTP